MLRIGSAKAVSPFRRSLLPSSGRYSVLTTDATRTMCTMHKKHPMQTPNVSLQLSGRLHAAFHTRTANVPRTCLAIKLPLTPASRAHVTVTCTMCRTLEPHCPASLVISGTAAKRNGTRPSYHTPVPQVPSLGSLDAPSLYNN